MKSRRSGLPSIAALLLTGVAAAQNRSAPVDLAATYDALYTNHITVQSFWMQGGAVELGAQAYRGLGIAARVEGLHEGYLSGKNRHAAPVCNTHRMPSRQAPLDAHGRPRLLRPIYETPQIQTTSET